MEVNGFHIVERCAGTKARYWTAKRGSEVFTSKDINYLTRKCVEQSPPNAVKAFTPDPFAHLVGR